MSRWLTLACFVGALFASGCTEGAPIPSDHLGSGAADDVGWMGADAVRESSENGAHVVPPGGVDPLDPDAVDPEEGPAAGDTGLLDVEPPDAPDDDVQPDPDPVPVSDPNGDPDRDGLTNRDEQAFGTDPRDPDTDDDGLSDLEELYAFSTDPRNTDSDGDGLTDGDEVRVHNTRPDDSDTDDGGADDAAEIAAGLNPWWAGDDHLAP